MKEYWLKVAQEFFFGQKCINGDQIYPASRNKQTKTNIYKITALRILGVRQQRKAAISENWETR